MIFVFHKDVAYFSKLVGVHNHRLCENSCSRYYCWYGQDVRHVSVGNRPGTEGNYDHWENAETR